VDPDRSRALLESGDRAGGTEAAATNEDLVAEAEAEAESLIGEGPVLGTPGPPLSRRSPFMIGLLGAAGVGVMWELGHLLLAASSVIALIGLSLFLAVGLEPAVQWLMRMRMPRVAAVAVVALAVVGVFVGFLAAAIPPLVAQLEAFVHQLPAYAAQIRNHSSTLGRLDARFHIEQRLSRLTSSANGDQLATGLLGAGRLVLSATVSALTVMMLTVYLLADLPRIRRLIYRLTPASRRARVILIGDEVALKVGWYVLGNLLTSLIAGAGTFVWLLAVGVPYPVVLASMVAVFDLIPVVGSTVAGVIVSLVALTVSLPVAIATAVFYTVYRLLEDYLIVPRVIGKAVAVPATVTIVAVLIGGAVLGLLGALVAIPVAAAIDILLRETVFPRLDEA
jgi:predicted PurR-regulated permease PerM